MAKAQTELAPELLAQINEDNTGQLPEDWQFAHGIDDISGVEHTFKIENYGVIQTHTARMEDGSEYRLNFGRPRHSKQKLDQLSLKTTAFLTKDDEGFNRHHQIREVKAGLPSLLISRELKWQEDLSQPRTAHNLLLIGKNILESNDSLDQNNIQARGISRGGMIALGVCALSQMEEKYKTNVFYFSATAPCYPRPIQITPKYLKMPLYEVTSLMYHLGKLPLNVLSHYPRSVDTNAKFAFLDARALVNGDAGKFVNYLSKDPNKTRGYVLGYPDDIMGMGEIWEQDFEGYDNVVVDVDADKLPKVFDGHLRAVSHHDLSDAMARQKRLIKEYKKTNGNLDTIDYQFVSLGK